MTLLQMANHGPRPRPHSPPPSPRCLSSSCPANLQVWLVQVEAQSSTHHITNQRTWYDYVVATLVPGLLTKVRDFLLAPPDTELYNAPKAQLIQRTVASKQLRLQQLFTAAALHCRGTRGQDNIATFAPDATIAG